MSYYTCGAFIIERQIPMQGYSEGCHLCRAECRGVIYGRRGLQNLQGKNDLNKRHLQSAFSPGFYRKPYPSIRRERPQVPSSG